MESSGNPWGGSSVEEVTGVVKPLFSNRVLHTMSKETNRNIKMVDTNLGIYSSIRQKGLKLENDYLTLIYKNPYTEENKL